jgi:hypothetical protein
MDANRDSDKELLLDLTKERLVDLLFLQLRNMWSVDGLYFIGIEDRFGLDGANDIDRYVWEVMGKIEARRLKETMGITGSDIPSMMKALRISSWALDLEEKEIIVEEERAILRNPNCRVQKIRLKKDLGEFPCKFVRWNYLKNFASEFNDDIEVNCNICPPDEHPEDLWCEWEFILHR